MPKTFQVKPGIAKKLKSQSEARKTATFGQIKQGRRITKHSDKINAPLHVGDNVFIQIPGIDKAKSDLPNVIEVVIEVSDDRLHEIGTKGGILNQMYSRYKISNQNISSKICITQSFNCFRSELGTCQRTFLTKDEVPQSSVALRTTAKAQSNSHGRGFVRCNCLKGCSSNTCSCKKSGILCNSKCHSSSNCKNK